jgi:hypothetical protein
MVQLAGFKTLAVLLSCSRYSDLLYPTTSSSPQPKDGEVTVLSNSYLFFSNHEGIYFVIAILFKEELSYDELEKEKSDLLKDKSLRDVLRFTLRYLKTYSK